jgi:hypothetical protein
MQQLLEPMNPPQAQGGRRLRAYSPTASDAINVVAVAVTAGDGKIAVDRLGSRGARRVREVYTREAFADLIAQGARALAGSTNAE